MYKDLYIEEDPIRESIREILLDYNKGLMKSSTAALLLEKYHTNHCFDIHQYLFNNEYLLSIYKELYNTKDNGQND